MMLSLAQALAIKTLAQSLGLKTLAPQQSLHDV